MVIIALQGDSVSSLLRVSSNVFVLPPVRTIGNRWTHPASTSSSCLKSIVIVIIMTNYPTSRCVEVMVCPTTTTAFFIEPLVLKRSTYLPSMMASAGAGRKKVISQKRFVDLNFKTLWILFLQTCNIVKIKKKLGNTPGAMELLNIFQHKREK